MDVRIEGTDFTRVAVALRSQSPELYKAMQKQMKARAEPVADAFRDAIRGVDVSNARGGGTAARAAWVVSRNRTVRNAGMGPLDQKKQARVDKVRANAKRSGGLRDTIARTVRTEFRAKGWQAGVTIRTNSSLLPPDQRNLPRAINRGEWRHPVFGNPDVWVSQTAYPTGWWTKTANRWAPVVRRELIDAFEKWAVRSGQNIRQAAEG